MTTKTIENKDVVVMTRGNPNPNAATSAQLRFIKLLFPALTVGIDMRVAGWRFHLGELL